MSSLHGSWLPQKSNEYLFVWGETWRTIPSTNNQIGAEVPSHPFNMTQLELVDFFQSHNLTPKKWLTARQKSNNAIAKIVSDGWQSQIIALPTRKTNKDQQTFPVMWSNVAAGKIELDSLVLQSWQIEGICLQPLEAAAFLQALPLGSFQDNYLGADLRFWSQIYRWSLDLLTRGKFLPGIASWQPLLDSSADQARFAKFTQLMPHVCRAYQLGWSVSCQPKELLLGFLGQMLNSQLQSWIDVSTIPKQGTVSAEPFDCAQGPGSRSTIQGWLEALTEGSSSFGIEPTQRKRLEHALDNWTLPVQDYLVTDRTATKLGENRFRVCFVLQPPTEGDINWGYFDWKLAFHLQAVDDPTFLVDSNHIWQHPVEKLVVGERCIQQPQETLLKGLGLASRLYPPIEASLHEAQPVRCTISPIQVYEFIRSGAWQLQDSGLGVILPESLTSGTGEKRLGIKIEAKVNQKKGERLGLQSLLQYKLKLAIGEETISKADFDKMLAQKSPIVQINGQWIALQPADVRAAQAVFSQLKQETLSVEDALRLTTGEPKKIANLPVVNLTFSGVLQELIENLTNNQTIELIQTPSSFQGNLRPYQIRGVSWLAFLEKWGLGACLADSMGMGKTPQLIAFILSLKEQNLLNKPSLIVCPTSVLGNWEREIKKFAPTLEPWIHHGDRRAKGQAFAKKVQQKDLVITSYALLYRDEKTLGGLEWQGIILDEAQNIKNPQAKQSQAVRKLKAGFRIALTGTPLENRLLELWSILDFLNPGFLGNQQFFQRRFAMPIEKYGDTHTLQSLRSLVQPFILRRLKTDKDIIKDLPNKQEMNVFCGLSAEQAQLYQKLVDESLEKIESAEGIKRRGLILTLLLRLKQLCNHPNLIGEKTQRVVSTKNNFSSRSGKLLRLEEMLEELVQSGDRALIFTQFAEWGKLLKPHLEQKLNLETLFLYGNTRRQQREEMIDRFQNDPQGPPIFILSLKAGGTGLNLTRANHVFHVDRWWNPAVENQATDRAFRIGQQRNVQVHKFVCRGTLEEKINDIIESKKQLAEQTVDAGEDWLTELDSDQLRNLLLLDREAVIDS